MSRRKDPIIDAMHRAIWAERMALLGCECASCSTVAAMEFLFPDEEMKGGREDNPVHYYLSMRAFGADRVGGSGMGWNVFEFYCTCIALIFKLDKFNSSWDFDDEYVAEMRKDAFQIAVDHGYLPNLGYEFEIGEVREYLATHPARTWGSP